LNLAAPTNSSRVNRGEFNVALALVALAQKNMGNFKKKFIFYVIP
jgi:hypothetical protein